MERRVKEEARSITANCNIKLFGKLEDPTQTKDFFEKTVGNSLVTEVSSFSRDGSGYADGQQAGVQSRARASYDGLKGFTEGRAICAFGKNVNEMMVYNSDIGDAKAMRVHRFLPIPPPSEDALDALRMVDSVLRRLRNPKWKADETPAPSNRDIDAMAKNFAMAKTAEAALLDCGIGGVAGIAEAHDTIEMPSPDAPADTGDDVRAAPPLNPVAEKAAAEAVAKAVPGGPLNWMEVIGGAETSALPLRRDPPVTEKPVSRAVPEVSTPPKPVSWEDVISAGGQTTQAVAAKAVEKAAGAALKSPISWMDVMGAAESTVGPNAVEEQRRSAPPVTEQKPVEAKAPSVPPAAPPADDIPDFLRGLAKLPPKDAKAPVGISWLDVIGADEDKGTT